VSATRPRRLDHGRKAGAVAGHTFHFGRTGLFLDHQRCETLIKMPKQHISGIGSSAKQSRLLSLMSAPEVKFGTHGQFDLQIMRSYWRRECARDGVCTSSC